MKIIIKMENLSGNSQCFPHTICIMLVSGKRDWFLFYFMFLIFYNDVRTNTSLDNGVRS